MINIEWIKKTKNQFNGNLMNYLADARNIEGVGEFLSPDSSVVNSPLDLLNIGKAKERVVQAISKHEKITVFADVDP